MKILVIGGTGFIGTHLVRLLSQMGHSVSIFHRGNTRGLLPAESILGDCPDLAALCPKVDVVIDLILSSGAQAQALRVCGPLANSLFHHRPDETLKPASKVETAYRKADRAIRKVIDLLAA
jgi:NAD dependent epimerase/dehydratase family enzyme